MKVRSPIGPKRHLLVPTPPPPMHVCDRHPSALGGFLYVLVGGLDLLLCRHCAVKHGPALVTSGATVAEVTR